MKILNILFAFFPFAASLSANADSLGAAVSKLEEVNAMREALAGTLNENKEPITEETFKRVCAPVGQTLKTWAQAEGYQVRQASHKYRNPNHKADRHDLEMIKELEKDPDRLYVIENRKINGVDGVHIYRRIDVRQSCLHCHGEAKSLPDFIKAKYPKDLANGFKPGDLRGVYSVWMKNPNAVIKNKE